MRKKNVTRLTATAVILCIQMYAAMPTTAAVLPSHLTLVVVCGADSQGPDATVRELTWDLHVDSQGDVVADSTGGTWTRLNTAYMQFGLNGDWGRELTLTANPGGELGPGGYWCEDNGYQYSVKGHATPDTNGQMPGPHTIRFQLDVTGPRTAFAYAGVYTSDPTTREYSH